MHAHADEHAMQELDELIRGIRVAMLTTLAPDGLLVSRPMYTRDRPFDGELWFFLSLDSDKVDELLQTPQVNIAYAAPDRNQYVSIAGEGAIVRDRVLIEALWKEHYDRQYFRGGKDDPSLVLLKVQAISAEVWNAGENLLTRAFNFAKAQLGVAPGDTGRRRHVDLRPH